MRKPIRLLPTLLALGLAVARSEGRLRAVAGGGRGPYCKGSLPANPSS
jgi:hypothetical protein